MITAQDIVNQAYEELSITQMGTIPDGRQTMYGLKAFSRMLSALTNEGVNIAPDLPLQNEFEKPLVAILAMEIAPRFGVEPMPMLVKRAANGLASLQAAFVVTPRANFDWALSNLPSQRVLGQRGLPGDVLLSLPSNAPAVTGFALLAVNSPTTTIYDANCLSTSVISLKPYTSQAQTEWDSGVKPTAAASVAPGSFVITHAVNHVDNRIFEYLLKI